MGLGNYCTWGWQHLRIALPSKFDIDNTSSMSTAFVWSVYGPFPFPLKKKKKIPRNANTSWRVPIRGKMIKKMTVCPFFEIRFSSAQGCSLVTFPHSHLFSFYCFYSSILKCFAIGKRTLQLITGYVDIWQTMHSSKVVGIKLERLLWVMFNSSKLCRLPICEGISPSSKL